MKSSRYSPEQVAFAMRQAESGTSVPEICRKMGIAEQTFYRWKKKYAGMGVVEVRKLRILEEENRKLKQLVADLSLDKQMLQDVLRKKAEACSETGGGEGVALMLPGKRAEGMQDTKPVSQQLSLP